MGSQMKCTPRDMSNFQWHRIHFMFGKGFSGLANRMALFPVRSNPGWQSAAILKNYNGVARFPYDNTAFCFSFMRIATCPSVGPIIAVNGLNDTFWWHSHSLLWLWWTFTPLAPKIWTFAFRPMAALKSHSSGTVKITCKMFAPNRSFRGRRIEGVILVSS